MVAKASKAPKGCQIPTVVSGLYGSETTLWKDYGEVEHGLHPFAAMVYSTSGHRLEEFRDSRILAEEFEKA
jgi:hypothetical protein